MNYCSIQEAWGKTDYITNQYKKYDNPVQQRNNPYQQRNTSEIKNSFPKKTLEKFIRNQEKIE